MPQDSARSTSVTSSAPIQTRPSTKRQSRPAAMRANAGSSKVSTPARSEASATSR